MLSILPELSEEDIVYTAFDTGRDVEDWEYSAIYDNFSEESFQIVVLT